MILKSLSRLVAVVAFTLLPWMLSAENTGVAVNSPLAAVRVFPNPWRSDQHADTSITFDHLPPQSNVRIFTVSGADVKSLSADDNGMVMWDRSNRSGSTVASGIYLFVVKDQHGNTTSGKLAVIN